MDNKFYTLTGYNRKEHKYLTNAMEDYLEMLYRIHIQNKEIHIKDIANSLNVKYPSVSKMMNRLKEYNFIKFEKYGIITLTKKGINYGKYFINRHEILVTFFKDLNKEEYKLEQVEKVEHFIDNITIKNIKKKLDNSNYL